MDDSPSMDKESEQSRARRRQAGIQHAAQLISQMPDREFDKFMGQLEQQAIRFGLGNQMTAAGGESPAPAYSGTITLDNADDAMHYQPWDRQQTESSDIIREALTLALKAILRHAPNSPRRTLAVQHLISARMDANAAISFRGRF